METRELGLVLLCVGALLAVASLLVYWGGFSWFGRLPGDITVRWRGRPVFLPITSTILLSLLLTLVARLV